MIEASVTFRTIGLQTPDFKSFTKFLGLGLTTPKCGI